MQAPVRCCRNINLTRDRIPLGHRLNERSLTLFSTVRIAMEQRLDSTNSTKSNERLSRERVGEYPPHGPRAQLFHPHGLERRRSLGPRDEEASSLAGVASLISVSPRAVDEKLPFSGARCSGERTFPSEYSLSSFLAFLRNGGQTGYRSDVWGTDDCPVKVPEALNCGDARMKQR